MSLISGDVIRDFDVEEVETACKLYSCDKLHLSQSTVSCDGVRLVVKFYLFWIFASAIDPFGASFLELSVISIIF